jgi:hypothetical protein
MSIARQQLSKHIPLATNAQTMREELLEALFYMWSVPKLYQEDQQDRDPKPRMTVLAKTSSNLPDQKDTGMISGVEREKKMVMSPEGPRTKNNCAGEGQQQFKDPGCW